tara:strand:- start:281 stop:1156 length:876 start_codon:yes stop_codon:yes gene_type:complete
MSFALESRMDMSHQLASAPEVGRLQAAKETNNPEALKAVAEEFESLFMNMMMKSMRSANRTLSEGNYFNSFESKMYEDMLDEKLSVSLSKNGGLGIADLLMRQFTPGPASTGYELEMGASEKQIFPAERRAGFDGPAQFVEALLPKAEAAAQALDTKAEFIVSQAALETGWGQHVMFTGDGTNSHNLFGIKANSAWQGPTVSIDSVEVESGVAAKVSSQFKVYPDYESALRDYAALIKGNDRYNGVAGAQTIKDFTAGLEQGGYATDPRYGQKIARVLGDLKSTHLTMRSE